jgi:hypothetical protein
MVKIVEYREKIVVEEVVVTHPKIVDPKSDLRKTRYFTWYLTFEQAKMLQQALNEELGGIDDELSR